MLKRFRRSPFFLMFLLLSIVLVPIALLIVPGLLLYLDIGRAARTPFQIYAACVYGAGLGSVLFIRLHGRGPLVWVAGQFYGIYLLANAAAFASALGAAVSGSVAGIVWSVISLALAIAYASGYLVERRRTDLRC